MPKRRANASVRRADRKRPTRAANDFSGGPRERSMRAVSSRAVSTKRADGHRSRHAGYNKIGLHSWLARFTSSTLAMR